MNGTLPTELYEEPYEISGLPTPKDERRKCLFTDFPLVKNPHFWITHMGVWSKPMVIPYYDIREAVGQEARDTWQGPGERYHHVAYT